MSGLSAQQITLRREQHDVVCIGFGACALSLAVAHQERNPHANIVFLEARSKSEWQPLRKLPGQDMQTTFMNDLITTENPRSRYSFVKYLHATGRLVNFTNVGKVNPSAELFEDYLRWAASKLESCVRYGTKAVAVEAVTDQSSVTSQWNVFAQDVNTGSRTIFTAKRVIVAVGSQPQIPKALLAAGDATVHASNCLPALQSKLRNIPDGASIAIIGDGQAAAELLQYLHGIRGKHTATLFTEQDSLHPSTESSFDQASRSKPLTATLQRLPPELRSQSTSRHTAPAASHLIERLYELQYEQGVKQPDPTKWRFQIKPAHKITATQPLPDGRVSLTTLDKLTSQPSSAEPRPFDLVIAATGYTQTEQQRLLQPLGRLLENGTVSVDANYRINMRRRGVVNGRGVWLVGSLAPERYAGDEVFGIMAERSRRLVDSLLAIQALESVEGEEGEAVQAHL